jgi:hypothetical protein
MTELICEDSIMAGATADILRDLRQKIGHEYDRLFPIRIGQHWLRLT